MLVTIRVVFAMASLLIGNECVSGLLWSCRLRLGTFGTMVSMSGLLALTFFWGGPGPSLVEAQSPLVAGVAISDRVDFLQIL